MMNPWPEGGMILKFGSRASFSIYSASVIFAAVNVDVRPEPLRRGIETRAREFRALLGSIGVFAVVPAYN
jgi:hypothetical protein